MRLREVLLRSQEFFSSLNVWILIHQITMAGHHCCTTFMEDTGVNSSSHSAWRQFKLHGSLWKVVAGARCESGLPGQVRGDGHLLGSRARIRSNCKMLLDGGADANNHKNPNQAPLIWAVGTYHASRSYKVRRGGSGKVYYHGGIGDRHAAVSLLLQYGADPSIMRDKVRGILLLVVEHGFNSKALVTQLLKAESISNTRDKNGCTPLMDATVRGMDQVVKAFLEAPGIKRDEGDLICDICGTWVSRRCLPLLDLRQ